jgi:NADPH:quinone reductase-like Zn-dependent oxidoreductase
VLLRVRACAVDQFDLSIRNGKVPHAKFPLVLGHEIAGEVASLGPGVTGWRVGERVVITGAGGGVGLHAIQLARLMGALVMAVDVGQTKLEAALENGADVVVDPTVDDFAEAAQAWTGGMGVAGVLELTGAATLATSLGALGKGGRVVIVGFHTGSEFSVQARQMVANEWEIMGSRNVSKNELAEVVALVESGRLRPIVTGRYPLEEAENVHLRLARQEIIGRVVLEP